MTALTEPETPAQKRERVANDAWSSRVVALVLAGVPLRRAWGLANRITWAPKKEGPRMSSSARAER